MYLYPIISNCPIVNLFSAITRCLVLKYSTGDNESDITLKVILKKYVLWMKMLTKRSMIEEITAQINDIEGEIFDAKEEIATQINDVKKKSAKYINCCL
ncbi:unnamed protein product [Rhizophagus irregularis]|nr:unnamed protein product [Rhizophagus irregularis]